MISAFQSVILLIVITRVCDVFAAGVFTFAYANANLFLNMGKYGMRPFQVSDRTGQFSFSEYRVSRTATVTAMVICSTAYLAYSSVMLDYSFEKTATVFLVTFYEALHAFEDVYMGHYQQSNRLDVGARLQTIRYMASISVFAIAIVAFKSLVPAALTATTFTACFIVGVIVYAKRKYKMPFEVGPCNSKQVLKLLKECFPLFAAAFLLFYIGNAPKYAIDAIMDDAAQAYYGYIAMPVFVVSLLASFVYNPMIASLAEQWRNRELRSFGLRFARIAIVIVCLTVACDVGAWLLGVPILNVLYNTELSSYLVELIVLVSGGGFLALASLFTLGITIIRFQRILVPVYAVGSIAAWALSNWAVFSWGITGASGAYFVSMLVLATLFFVTFVLGVKLLKDA